MFFLGAFRPSFPTLHGGLTGKLPLKVTRGQKARIRKRLKAVDSVLDAVRASGVPVKALEKLEDYPKESEMTPREKYSVFSAVRKNYRKPITHVPHFTKIHLERVTPVGF